MPEVFVVPREGFLVPHDPDRRPIGRKHLVPEGETVTDSTWWRRREREGDVTIYPSRPGDPGEEGTEQ